MTNPRIIVERDGAIATVTLSNPDKLNALTVSMWQELKRVMDELSADDALRPAPTSPNSRRRATTPGGARSITVKPCTAR